MHQLDFHHTSRDDQKLANASARFPSHFPSNASRFWTLVGDDQKLANASARFPSQVGDDRKLANASARHQTSRR